MSIKFEAHGSIPELMTLNNVLQASDQIDGIKVGRLYRGKDPNKAHQHFEVLAKPSTRYEFIPRRRETAGYVYLLQTAEEGVYKIGKTKDPYDRQATFNVKLPFRAKMIHVIETDNRHVLEKQLQGRFERQGKRILDTEFFNLTPSDVDYIQSL